MRDRNINILILTNRIFSINERQKDKIMDTAQGADLTVVKPDEVTEEMLSKADIIFGWPKKEELKKAINLKWLQLPSAGADDYTDLDLYAGKEILLTNSSGVYGLPIAEHVFALILSYNRNLQEYALLKNEKSWNRIYAARDFYGSTVGIIGLGDIGKEVAKRAKAWGARVLAVKRTLSPAPEYVDRLYLTEQMDEVLKQADYVVLTLPGTEKTRGILTRERLRRMKPGAFLVNIGRGELIDQDALIQALKEHWIGGAGLDVTYPEPLPYENPLWELPNVIITQHSSGFSPGNDDRRVTIFMENLILYLDHKPLQNLVDFTEGY